ncbi:MAG: four helix bundle protein [Bacteroidales bacterium]|nr:four helix bundle protein [Bacteroidales bacterium]MBN2820113.1 four helix bundle protein [Bacteroidales bacterium]
MKYKSFHDMEVWQQAMNLSVEIFEISKSLPKCEDYGLTSQIRRSANSVCANIAEAFGRNTGPDKSRMYVIAKGSAYETQSHIIYGTRVKYFDYEITNILVENYETLIKGINKIIKSLK